MDSINKAFMWASIVLVVLMVFVFMIIPFGMMLHHMVTANTETPEQKWMHDAKERECKADVRCASYDRRSGAWYWKPGQQPPTVIRIE